MSAPSLPSIPTPLPDSFSSRAVLLKLCPSSKTFHRSPPHGQAWVPQILAHGKSNWAPRMNAFSFPPFVIFSMLIKGSISTEFSQLAHSDFSLLWPMNNPSLSPIILFSVPYQKPSFGGCWGHWAPKSRWPLLPGDEKYLFKTNSPYFLHLNIPQLAQIIIKSTTNVERKYGWISFLRTTPNPEHMKGKNDNIITYDFKAFCMVAKQTTKRT